MCYLLLLIVIMNTICNTTMVLCYYCLLIIISATNIVRQTRKLNFATQTKFCHAKPNLGWIQTRQNVKWGAAWIVLGILPYDPCYFFDLSTLITLTRMQTIQDVKSNEIHDCSRNFDMQPT